VHTSAERSDVELSRAHPLGVQSRAVSTVSAIRSRTRRRLSACDAILERLAQDLQDMAAELGQFIQEEHAMVDQ
jgi:hypothetical protein